MFIKIKQLSKAYKNYLAVNKINFQIERNKTVGLLGPNGCGKTTTIGMILGLVTPTEGEILIEDNFSDYCYLLIYLIFDIYLRSILEKINFLDQPAVELLKKNTKA